MIVMDPCCIPSVFPLPTSALLCFVMPAGWSGCGQDYAKRTDGFQQNLVGAGGGWGPLDFSVDLDVEMDPGIFFFFAFLFVYLMNRAQMLEE